MFAPRHLALALAAAIGLAAPLAAADIQTAKDYLVQSGLGGAVGAYQDQIAAIPERTGKADTDVGKAWSAYAVDAFDPEALRAEVVEKLAETLPQDAGEAALAFYETPFGARIVAIEKEAQMGDQRQILAQGGALLQPIIAQESPRLDAYFRLIAAAVPVDRKIDFSMELQVKVLTAFGVQGQAPGAIPENQIRQAVAGSRPQIEQGVVGEVLTRFAYTYRDLTDEDLAQYAESLETPAMKAAQEAAAAALFDVTDARLAQVAEQVIADLK